MKASTIILWIVFISLITFGLVTACIKRSEAAERMERNEEVYVKEYKVVGSHYADYVQKITIEGHEYLMFFSKLAFPPTVVHNENCPCKEDKKDVEAN